MAGKPGATDPLTPRQVRRVERYAAEWRPGAFLRRMYPALYRAARAVGMDHEDIEQCAWVGVVRAAQKYRPGTVSRGRPVGFHTYANLWVRGAVTHAVRRAMARGRAGVAVNSGDRPLPGDRSGRVRCRWDVTPAARGDPAAAAAARVDLAAALRAMPARTRRVVELRAAGATLAEVAAEVGVTRERVRQIQADAAARGRGEGTR